MLEGSPQTYLHDPILKYLDDRGVKVHTSSIVKDIVHEVTGDPVEAKQ